MVPYGANERPQHVSMFITKLHLNKAFMGICILYLLCENNVPRTFPMAYEGPCQKHRLESIVDPHYSSVSYKNL